MPDGKEYYFIVEAEKTHAAYNGLGLGKTFKLPEDLESIPEIELAQSNSVTTTVTLNGKPAGDVSVRLSGKDAGPFRYATTDSYGVATFSLTQIPCGLKRLSVFLHTLCKGSGYQRGRAGKAIILPFRATFSNKGG